jgi:hypothetical protein
MTELETVTGNPYVGPRSFTRTEKKLYFGREREARELSDLLLAERIVLVHSPSGAGKTSLIETQVVPAFLAERFHVYPTIRVHAPAPGPNVANRYVRSTLASLQSDSTMGELSEEQLARMTLTEYLALEDAHRIDADADADVVGRSKMPAQPVLLIFDQFEEILTADPGDHDGRLEFFRDLGEALRARHRWALFSMREEYVAQLDPCLARIPGGLAKRYQVPLLPVADAEHAVRGPAELAGRQFTDNALRRLLLNLRTVRDTETCEPRVDPFVEPVYLQVVCRTLWNALGEEVKQIEESHVEKCANVDVVLKQYFAECVRDAAGGSDALEGKIRLWIRGELITHGRRAQVLQGAEAEHGVTSEAVKKLVNSFVIRIDNRRSTRWYELAHDRLVEPALRDMDDWLAAHGGGDLHQRALAWIKGGRLDADLLTAESLRAAEKVAAEHPEGVTPQLMEHVRASQNREKMRRMRLYMVGAGAVAVLVLMLGGAFWFVMEANADKARIQALADAERQADSLKHEWGIEATADSATLALSFAANRSIQSIQRTGAAHPKADTVVYFLKSSDPGLVRVALSDLGFPLKIQTPYIQNPTNAIASGRAADVDNVKLVALALLRAGVKLQYICKALRANYGDHAIQVLGKSIEGQDPPPITVEQVQRLVPGRDTVQCGR